jgi:aspartate 1-decarboxylase
MQRQLLTSKIHRATVTDCDVDHGTRYSPVVVHVNDRNEVVATDSDPSVLLGDGNPHQGASL